MNINKPPIWIRKIYPSLHWKIDSTKKELYITFDDGPTPEVTPWVLKELNKFNVKATFFCVGRNVELHPEIYKQILDQGHAVGNHTYSHLNGWRTKPDEYVKDVILASDLIQSNLFRPPYGRIKHKQIESLKKLGFKIFTWDVLSEDYNKNIDKNKCLENVLKNTEECSIIVFHDSVKASENLYGTLPKVLQFYTEKGYKFRRLK